MKKVFSVFLAILVLFSTSFYRPLTVEASSFQVDYSSVYTASQFSSMIAGLDADALAALVSTIGTMAYGYLQSVNVKVNKVSSSQPGLEVVKDLGKKILAVISPVNLTRMTYEALSSGTKYLLTTLTKKADSGEITEQNFTDLTFEWKSQVSQPYSDIFNVFDPMLDLVVPDPDAFQSVSGTIAYNLWDTPLSSFVSSNPNLESIYENIHFSFPTGFSFSSSSQYAFTDLVGVYNNYSYNQTNFSFDTIIFFSSYDFTDTNTYYFIHDNSSLFSFVPHDYYPVILYNSVSDRLVLSKIRSSNTTNFFFRIDSSSPNYALYYSNNHYTLGSPSISYDTYVDRTKSYSLLQFANYYLGYSNIAPDPVYSFYDTSSRYHPFVSNINAYTIDFVPGSYYLDLADLNPLNLNPDIVIDSGNAYIDRQLPIDNVGSSEALYNLGDAIDRLDQSLSGLSNIDFLTDAITDGVVGSIPQISSDAWNPDRVSSHVSSTDISSTIDGLSGLEGIFTDNVAPVFTSYPVVPFINPIIEFLTSDVARIIYACIFLVVLFGFLNKLLY